MSTGDLRHDVLAHLHANSAQPPAQLAAIIGVPVATVEAIVETAVAEGDLEREGARLVPGPNGLPTPGIFVSTERGDAEPEEIDL